MNLSTGWPDLDLSQINIKDMGSWPRSGKIGLAMAVAFIVVLLSYFFLIETQVSTLNTAQKKESELRLDYQQQFAKAVALDMYQRQMLDMEIVFSTLLKQLPTSHETPSMLDDITFAGTSVGLNFVRIHWMSEIEQEFYTELPIQIEVIGDYHQIGNFISEIAKLPRVVSLHDFQILSLDNGKQRFSVIAKTYRYKE